MSRPVPGSQYTIKDENTLSLVARRAYGDATFWRRIWNANQTNLRSNDPDLIFPGETILIPELPERQITIQDSTKNPLQMLVNIDGFEIIPQQGRFIRSMDLLANAFNVVIPWEYGAIPALDERTRPKTYRKATASLGNTPIVTGKLYTPDRQLTGQGRTLGLEGFTTTVDLVDSTLKPPFEYNDITLDDLLDEIVKPLGYNVIIEADTGGKFDRVTAQQGQSIFSFLRPLALQKNVLLSCNTGTDLVVLRANLDGAPVATLEEGVTLGVTGWGSRIDGRQSFNTYRATGTSPLGNAEAVVQDNAVPVTRFKDVRANEADQGALKSVAEWERNKTLADALSFSLTVEDWYLPNGQPWEENTLVTVKSETMLLPDGFNFLINRVEYVLSDNGRSTVLSFVPPTAYTKGEIVDPWR
jgi:prophage tail gpP-like protein